MMGTGKETPVVYKLRGLLLAAAIAGCRFEPDIAPLELATLPSQPFGEAVPSEGGEPSMADVERLLDELFDPYNLPLGITYRDSVYQVADEILAGAYAYYGYDLAELAASRQDNPLTLEDFWEYLEHEGLRWITDPVTDEAFDVYTWIAGDLAVDGPEAIHAAVLQRIGLVDAENPMNYERNYLNALFAAYSDEVERERYRFANELVEIYGDNAAAIYEYLQSLDLMGTE